MPLPEIEEILEKFKKEEDKVEKILMQKSTNREKLKVDLAENEFISFEDVKKRNKTLIKEFETVKGKLRSKAIFCPTEVQWENVCREYQDEPSLPVTLWKRQPPVFV